MSLEKDLNARLRSLILSPSCLLFSFFIAGFVAIFTPAHILASLPLAQRFFVNLADMGVFLAYSYILIPPALAFGLSRDLPLYWIQVALYAPLVLVLAWFIEFVTPGQPTLTGVLWVFSAAMALVVLAALVGMFAFLNLLLPSSGLDPDSVTVWFPRKKSECRLQPFLPRPVRGTVLRMKSENQYVRVTTSNGEALVRFTLTEAAKLLPANSGLRVHRSHWIASDQIADLRFERGNPRVIGASGLEIPVSRSKAHEVKRVLNEKRNNGAS